MKLRVPAFVRAGLAVSLAVVGVQAIALAPAFAATAITQPSSNPFSVPLDASRNALPFDIAGSGYNGLSVVPEICDGVASSVSGWTPADHCDLSTSPAPQPADSSGNVLFSASDPNQQISDFNGGSPNGQFNCIAQQDVPADATPGSFPGEYMLSASDTQIASSGQALNPSTPAWTNCQLRLSSNDSFVTSDQQFVTLTIPGIGSKPVSVGLQTDLGSPQPAATTITLTASVTPTGTGGSAPTGSVTFTDGGTPVAGCSNVALADPTCQWTSPVTGLHVLQVTYSGDSQYLAGKSQSLNFTLQARPSSVLLAAPAASTRGDAVVITATVSGTGPTPTGSVKFTSNGTPIVGCEYQPVAKSGVATCDTTLLLTGTDTLGAHYGGDQTYLGGNSNSVQIAVSAPPPPARLTPSILLKSQPVVPQAGARFTLIASVYGSGLSSPTGTVAFFLNGRAVPGCSQLTIQGGLALCSTSSSRYGLVTVTAAYSGDSSYLPVGSPRVQLKIARGGYWLASTDGGVFSYGDAPFLGSLGAIRLTAPIVTMAPTPDGGGYWLMASDGGVFAFGDARFAGSLGALHLNAPIVAMAATPDGHGYWLVASDGGVFAFGDARFHGSLGALRLAAPIVGMAATQDGRGYWLVASDGGIFGFGDARFRGSLGRSRLSNPIVGMASIDDGGYWLVGSGGTVYPFGDARFYGSAAGHTHAPVVAISPTAAGYRIFTADGGVFAFGDAPFLGSAGGIRLAKPIVAATAMP